MNLKETTAIQHIKRYEPIYIFMLILFIIGLLFGAIIVNNLSHAQDEDIFSLLNQFFSQLNGSFSLNEKQLFQQRLYSHLIFLSILFLFGCMMIGIPFIWLIIFLKGLILGFSVGVVIKQFQTEGLYIILTSILPQNIIIIPIYIVAGVMSMMFSLQLMYKLRGHALSLRRILKKYIFIYCVCCIFLLLAVLIETYLSTFLLQKVLNVIITN